MIVDDFERFFADLLQVLESYNIDIIDIKKFIIIWLTLVIICSISMILCRVRSITGTSLGGSQILPKIIKTEDKINALHQLIDQKVEESINNDPKSRIMMNYRKKLRELHMAADKCYRRENIMKCIEIVSQFPSLVNAKCPTTGFTPFHRVCCHRNSCLISFMLSHGADPWIETKTGENALCILLRSYLQSPKAVDFTALKILQKAGCYLDRRDKWYQVFLDTATYLGNKPLSLWIIEHSAMKITKQNSFP